MHVENSIYIDIVQTTINILLALIQAAQRRRKARGFQCVVQIVHKVVILILF